MGLVDLFRVKAMVVVEWVWGCQRGNITATTATSNSKTPQPIGNDTFRAFNTSKPKLAGTIPSINTTNKSLIHPFVFTSSTRYLRYLTLPLLLFNFHFSFTLSILGFLPLRPLLQVPSSHSQHHHTARSNPLPR